MEERNELKLDFGAHLRITNICRIGQDHVDISEGLAVEQRLDDGHFIVIAFVDANEDGAEIRNVGYRVLEFLEAYPNETALFTAVMRLAVNIVDTANLNEEDY